MHHSWQTDFLPNIWYDDGWADTSGRGPLFHAATMLLLAIFSLPYAAVWWKIHGKEARAVGLLVAQPVAYWVLVGVSSLTAGLGALETDYVYAWGGFAALVVLPFPMLLAFGVYERTQVGLSIRRAVALSVNPRSYRNRTRCRVCGTQVPDWLDQPAAANRTLCDQCRKLKGLS